VKRNLHAGGTRSRGLSVNVFTETELEDIHLASLEVLERTGVFVEADDARDIFRDGGCTVDPETRMVRIPPHVVEDAIASSPSKYVLFGRDAKNDLWSRTGSRSPTSARASPSSTWTPARSASAR
jgi:trimethylamine--corrinoid protein Co-methyltransferase